MSDRKGSTIETLLCIGGPLNAVRLSVPCGLQWFTLNHETLAGVDPHALESGVVAFEDIQSGVKTFGLTADSSEADGPGKPPLYVRDQFVTGESGLIHVFSFRQD